MKAHRVIILLSATILVTAMSAKAEDPVNIPDPALKAAVMEALGLTTDPTPTDMLALGSLDASARGITDLTGLEYGKNLVMLSLSSNLISDIRPLRDLTLLTNLDLASNRIAAIEPLIALTGLTELAELWLSGNPLPARACAIDIPLIKANNPGIVIQYDGCVELPQMLTVSSTEGGSVVMPGEGLSPIPTANWCRSRPWRRRAISSRTGAERPSMPTPCWIRASRTRASSWTRITR